MVDVRRGVPDDVYLVVYSRQNPERAGQYRHYAEVWKTIWETQIIDRLFEVVTAGMAAERREQAQGVMTRLRKAVKPIDFAALMDAKEVIYARSVQMSPVPFFHHLILVRATPEVIASTAAGMKNLFGVAEDYTDGKFAELVESTEGEANVCGIALPAHLPLQPAVAQMGDLLVFSSSKDMLRKSLAMLVSGTGASKFDDPRLAAALRQLPEMEDHLVFYDGKARLAALRGFGPFLQAVSDGDENVERFVKILDKVWDDTAILDYEVTVGYTEGNLNRSASYGKLLPNTGDATLRKVMFGAQPFEKWYAWVPANALSCSLGQGVNLHLLYERIMAILKEDVPASAELLARFEAIQEQYDVHLDADILQAFSGQYVLVSVPATGSGQSDFVMALPREAGTDPGTDPPRHRGRAAGRCPASAGASVETRGMQGMRRLRRTVCSISRHLADAAGHRFSGRLAVHRNQCRRRPESARREGRQWPDHRRDRGVPATRTGRGRARQFHRVCQFRREDAKRREGARPSRLHRVHADGHGRSEREAS